MDARQAPARDERGAMTGRLSPLAVLRLYPPHDASLMGALESRIQADPAAPFLLYRGRTWTRGEFRAAALSLARALTARGVRSGDRVGIVARNHEAHVLLLFALARIGAILVPTNPEFGVEELRYVFGKAEVSAIAASPECLATARAAMAGQSVEPWFIAIDGADDAAVSFAELLQASEPVALPPNPPAGWRISAAGKRAISCSSASRDTGRST